VGRRDYKTGSVYQRASDGRWLGTIEAGYTPTGGRRRITVTGKTEAIVKRKLRDKRLQVERDGLPSTGTRFTVKRWADDWLEARRTEVRAKPWATDASAVRRWIVPTIGHRQLEQLTPADVRAVTNAQRKAGLSSSTRHRTHITLTAMLKAAMIDGHQVPARVLLVKAPEQSDNPRDAMPVADIEAVMAVAVEMLPHWSRWLVQVLYGQRPAEVLGFTWPCIDFENKLLSVEWQLQSLPYVDPKDKARGFVVKDGMRVRHLTGAWHLTPPKTRKGFRVLPMLPIVEAALLQWREVAPESPHELVWPTTTGRPANEKHDLTEWHALQATAGVGHPDGRPWDIYEARHGFATRLMEEKVDQRIIEDLMGHSSIITSRGYMHVDRALALEALEQTNRALMGPTV